MTMETPNWMQDGTYPARLDRHLIAETLAEGVLSGLTVTQRAAGANNSVDVAAGSCVIEGDDQADQGSYLCRSTAVVNVVVTAAPGANKRRDLIIARVRDGNAGGGDSPSDADWVLEVVTGTDIDASNPDPPAVPDTAILLATLLRSAGEGSVTNAVISSAAAQVGGVRGVSMWDKEWTLPAPDLADDGQNFVMPWTVPVRTGWRRYITEVRHGIRGGTTPGSANVVWDLRKSGDGTIDGVSAGTVLFAGLTSTITSVASPVDGGSYELVDGDLIAPVVSSVTDGPDNWIVRVSGLLVYEG